MSFVTMSGYGDDLIPDTSVDDVVRRLAAQADAAHSKADRANAALTELYSDMWGRTDPSDTSKDTLYFGNMNTPGFTDNGGTSLLVEIVGVVDEMSSALAALPKSLTPGTDAYRVMFDRLTHEKQFAQAILTKWKWYEFTGGAGSVNSIDQAEAYVKEAQREAKEAVGLPKDKPIFPDLSELATALKWGIGIFIAVQILQVTRK